jgi:glycosyltransferase involved in cell wall biosynthesis
MPELSEPAAGNERLSLCMIVKNEQSQLGRCLRSIRPWVDEIVVVDTGSDDATKDIAKGFGAKIYDFQWCDDFAAARNYSLDQATGDWVLFLDADEELAPGSGPLLRQAIAHPNVEGFLCRIICLFGPQDRLSGNTVSVLRLFHHRPEYRFVGRVHEQIVDAILKEKNNQKLGFIPITIIHYGYFPEIRQLKNKDERNLKLLLKQLEENGPNPVIYFYIGNEYFAVKKDALALEYLLKAEAINDFEPFDQCTLLILHTVLLLLFTQGRYMEIIERVEKSLTLYPGYTDLYYIRSQARLQMKDYNHAWLDYVNCLKLGEAGYPYPSTTGFGGFQVWLQLGLFYQADGNWLFAKKAFQESLRLNPWLAQAWQGLRNLITNAANSWQEWQLLRLFFINTLKLDIGIKLIIAEIFGELAGWNWVEDILSAVIPEQITPENSDRYHFSLGCAHFFQRHWNEAFACFDRIPETETAGLSRRIRLLKIQMAWVKAEYDAAGAQLQALDSNIPEYNLYRHLHHLFTRDRAFPEELWNEPAIAVRLTEAIKDLACLQAEHLLKTLCEHVLRHAPDECKNELLTTLISQKYHDLTAELLQKYQTRTENGKCDHENNPCELLRFQAELCCNDNRRRDEIIPALRRVLAAGINEVRYYLRLTAELSVQVRKTLREATADYPEFQTLLQQLARRIPCDTK